ncbi:hypothetical protein ACIQWR_37680 [Streptomyces sp. NPDC098789]
MPAPAVHDPRANPAADGATNGARRCPAAASAYRGAADQRST